MTVRRGEIVVEDGELLARPGSGRFVKRALDPALGARPVV
jgi:hypothetical protein